MAGLNDGASGLSQGTGLSWARGLSGGAGLINSTALVWLLTSGVLPATLGVAETSVRNEYDSSGNLVYAPNNLLLQSQTLSNASWTASGVTVSGTTTTAPDGSLANLIVPSASASTFKELQQNISMSAGASYQFSGYVKAGGYRYVMLVGTSSEAGTFKYTFDTQTGVETDSGTGTSILLGHGISDAGNGWYRVWVSLTSIGTGSSARISIDIVPGSTSNRGVSWTGDGTSGVYQWGFQTSQITSAQAASVQTYNPTTSASYYGPRFDYDPSSLTAKGLLLEGARTNSITYARDLTQAGWVKTTTTAAKDQTGIDSGASSASSLLATAGNATTLFATTQVSSVQMFSAYIKRITGTGNIQMTMDGGMTWTTVTITAAWARYTIPAQTLANPSFGFRIVTNGDKIAVDVAQGELLSSATQTASSPMLTSGSALTRTLDLGTLLAQAAQIAGASQGTMVFEFTATAANPGTGAVILGATTGTPLYIDSATGKLATTNGTNVLLTASAPNYTAGIRVVIAWNPAGRSIGATGVAIVSDANPYGCSGTFTVLSAAGLLTEDAWLSQAAFYPDRLSAAACAAKVIMGTSL